MTDAPAPYSTRLDCLRQQQDAEYKMRDPEPRVSEIERRRELRETVAYIAEKPWRAGSSLAYSIRMYRQLHTASIGRSIRGGV